MLFTSHASTLLLLLSASLSQAAPFASTNGTNGPTATIDSGVVIGTQTSLAATNGTQKTVNQYLGVRFAASPTRFSPPQTATPWSSPLNVTQRGPACIQVGHDQFQLIEDKLADFPRHSTTPKLQPISP